MRWRNLRTQTQSSSIQSAFNLLLIKVFSFALSDFVPSSYNLRDNRKLNLVPQNFLDFYTNFFLR